MNKEEMLRRLEPFFDEIQIVVSINGEEPVPIFGSGYINVDGEGLLELHVASAGKGEGR